MIDGMPRSRALEEQHGRHDHMYFRQRLLGLDVTGINPMSILIAVGGVVLFLGASRLIPGRQPFERYIPSVARCPPAGR